MLRKTMAVGPPDEFCVTGGTGVASRRTCWTEGFGSPRARSGRTAAGNRRAIAFDQRKAGALRTAEAGNPNTSFLQ